KAKCLESEDDHRERGNGSARIGQIDRKVAETAVVPEHNPDRQCDKRADDDRLDRELNVLPETRGDAIRTLSVGRIGEPLPEVLQKTHCFRDHGSAIRWVPASERSRNSASAIDRMVATTSGV